MKLKTLMMSAAISALIAGNAVAQTDTTDPAPTDGTVAGTADVGASGDTAVAPEFTSISEMTVGDLVGQNVYGPDGDTVGDIDYVVGQGGGALAVVGIGGFLGLGEYTVALPLSDFGYDASQQMVTLDTTKDELKQQAEFDESDVESLPDETPLAGLVGNGDAGVSPTMTDEAPEEDAATMDSAVPGDDAGAVDDMETEGTADTEMGIDDAASDDAAAPGDAPADTEMGTDDAASDDAAAPGDAPADTEMTTEENAEDGEAVTTE